ncbi:hypothetical protein A2U01_0104415, partial [Trifolium medium]|nr:hypothetical protein [Trifolium medium]
IFQAGYAVDPVDSEESSVYVG